ncbi:interaptin [Salmo trutta]|uniref:interaptin n=1 Tax=Salmo trutta TaxID=8032 RepID=UPI0011315DC1|nr:interaptin-like [Salmo trutta]
MRRWLHYLFDIKIPVAIVINQLECVVFPVDPVDFRQKSYITCSMGGRQSKTSTDEDPLITNEELDEEEVLFNRLDFVLIGRRHAGKSTVGNIILDKKFSFWIFSNKQRVKKRHQKITVIRTPGWSKSGLYNSEKTIKQQIKNSVKSFKDGPNAVLLVIDSTSEESSFNECEQNILEYLLTKKVWDHTVVLFTKGEKLAQRDLTEQNLKDTFQHLIRKCGNRCHVLYDNKPCKEQNREVIKTLEDMSLKNEYENFYVEQDAIDSVTISTKRLMKKIALKGNILNKIKKLYSRLSIENGRSNESLQNEIKKLKEILKQKDEDITRLQSCLNKQTQTDSLSLSNIDRQTQTDCPGPPKENQQKHPLMVEDSNDDTNVERKYWMKEVKERDREIEQLKTELGKQASYGTIAEPLNMNRRQDTNGKFIKKHKVDLVKRIGLLRPILLLLQERGVLNDDEKVEVDSKKNKTLKNEALTEMVLLKGACAQEQFYQVLREADPFLVKDLEEKTC